MNKFLFTCLLFAACNNTATTDTKKDSSIKPVDTAASAYTKEAEMNFVDACVESSKQRLGETKAYTTCKCIFDQVKQQNPTADSTAMETILADSAQIAAMAAKCK